MTLVRGDAMELPFLDNSFDIVLSRLAFHHFSIQSNVCRVLKPNGKLVLIDLEAAEESLRNTEDEIDRLRVPSHMRNLSRAEMLALYQTHDLPVECCEVVKPAVLQNGWIIPKRRRRYRWILRGRWSGRLRVEKNRLCPLLQRRKDSVRPLMDLKHRCKRRRVVKGVFPQRMRSIFSKKVVDKRREIWYYSSCVRGYSTVG